MDQPRRAELGRGPHRPGPGRPARGAHPGVERDSVLRRLHPAHGSRLGAARPALLRAIRRPVDRVPAARAAHGAGTARRERLRYPAGQPGEVWEENEFWIELSWRIDPDGSHGIRRYYESRE